MALGSKEGNVVNSAHALEWNSTLHCRSCPRAPLCHVVVWNSTHLHGVGVQLANLLIFGPFEAHFDRGL